MTHLEATFQARNGQASEAASGFAMIPNNLLRLASPVALAVFARMASTPRIWMRRGSLPPSHVHAPVRQFAADLGASLKEIRGALAWLIASGYVERCATGNGQTGVFRVLGARSRGGLSVVPATPSDVVPNGKGHASPEKGTVEGTVAEQPKLIANRGLEGCPQGERARSGAQVLKDVKTTTTTSPPNPPADRKAPAPAGQGGGVASQGGDGLASDWAKAHRGAGRDVPTEKANHQDRYREYVLRKLLGDGDRDALLRDMAAFAVGGDGGGVSAFEAWRTARRESAERESAYAARHGLPSGDWRALCMPVVFSTD